jgi:hypothetical protein
MLVGINVLKHLDASLNQSKPLSQLQTRHGPLLKLMLTFLRFFKGVLLPNFNKMAENQFLITVVQLLELQHRTYKFAPYIGSGANDVNAE